MAYTGDPYPSYDPNRDPAYTNAPVPRYGERGPDVTREVTAGPFRFGLRDGILGTIGLFTILGVVLGILGFAAAFALDEARDDAAANNDAEAAATALPAFLVSVLPFMAAPVLALGLGSWAGHASRDAGIGAMAGAIGSFVGPILMLLLTGVGFALGAGAANLDLSSLPSPVVGVGPGWGTTIPYLFTGGGLLWLLANTLAGGLSGGLLGGILSGRWMTRRLDRRRYARRSLRY